MKSLYKNLVFKSPEIKKILKQLESLSTIKNHLFLIGEAGTGKREIAQIYHKMVWGSENGFLHINSSNIDSEIGYSTLFGYKKGSFTGAVEDKRGILDKLKTIYISSIELLPHNLHSPLLTLMEKGKYLPLGSSEAFNYEGVVIVSTTVTDKRILKEKISDSLFYFLNSKAIEIPPLRKRDKDKIEIAKFVLNKLNKKTRNRKSFSKEFLDLIKNYHFKGNIRELINFVEKAYIESGDSDLIKIKNSDMYMLSTDNILKEAKEELLTMDELEKRYFLEIFKITGGNKTKIAKILGISRKSVYNYLKRYGLSNGKD